MMARIGVEDLDIFPLGPVFAQEFIGLADAGAR
jgi:hypothetical protein